MKKHIRIVSLLLVLLTIASITPFATFAADETTGDTGGGTASASISDKTTLEAILGSGHVNENDIIVYANLNDLATGTIGGYKDASTTKTNGIYAPYTTTQFNFVNSKNDGLKIVDLGAGNKAVTYNTSSGKLYLDIINQGCTDATKAKAKLTGDKKFVVQFDVKRGETVSGGALLQVVERVSSSPNTSTFVYVNQNGTLYSQNTKGEKVGELSKDKFTTIAVYVDPGKDSVGGKYYIYIDGVNVNPEGYDFPLGTRTGDKAGPFYLSAARMYYVDNGNLSENAMYFDNIQAYYVDDTYTSNDYIGSKVRLLGNSLSMDGMIGVNYYLSLDSELASNVSDLKATFTVNGVDQESTITSTDKGYKVTAYVPAAEMMKSITGKITDKDGSVVYNFATTTAQEIAMNYVNGDYDDKAKAAAKAMLNYAAAAQTYFGIDTDKLANKDLSEADQKVNYTSVSNPTFEYTTNNSSWTYHGSQLQLVSSTTVYNYFDFSGTTINTFKLSLCLNDYENSIDYEVVNGNRIKVKLEGFSACDLDTEYKLILYSQGGDIFTFTYSATQYIQDVINAYSTSENAKEQKLVALVKALAVYNQAADAYAAKL